MRSRFSTAQMSVCLIVPPAAAVIAFIAYALFRVLDGSPYTQIIIADAGDGLRFAAASHVVSEPEQLPDSAISVLDDILKSRFEFDWDSFNNLSVGVAPDMQDEMRSALRQLSEPFRGSLESPPRPLLYSEWISENPAFNHGTVATAVPEPAAALLALIGTAAVPAMLPRSHHPLRRQARRA